MIDNLVLCLTFLIMLGVSWFILNRAEKKSIERENRWYELAKRYVEKQENK